MVDDDAERKLHFWVYNPVLGSRVAVHLGSYVVKQLINSISVVASLNLQDDLVNLIEQRFLQMTRTPDRLIKTIIRQSINELFKMF